MALEKKYLEDSSLCKVTFSLSKEIAKLAKTVHLVGEFNDWDEKATPMKQLKDGSFSVTLDLERGREYQFRYLIDHKIWENDWNADKYALTHFGDCDNSVVVV
ncbi:MAG TPA: isoamylase early set domain-containing protein [bacterium]